MAVLFLVLVGFAMSLSQMSFQENIKDILPQDKEMSEVSELVENLAISNRLVILVSDPNAENPDELVQTAKAISDSLEVQYADLISEITLKISNQRIEKLYGYYTDNLPFYLEGKDYDVVANRIAHDSVTYAMQRMYRVLASPMGMVGNKFIIDDPLGLVGIPLLKAKDFNLDQDIHLYQNHLVSEDRKNLMFFVDLANPGSETDLNGKLVDGLDEIIQTQMNQSAEVDVVYFGSPAMAVANARQIKSDINITVSIALLFLMLFISFYYRKFQTFLLVLLPGLFGALAALSVLALVRDSVSIISLGIGSILLGITIDYALHMMTHMKHEKDMRKVFKDLTFPTIICSLTSASAFLSLLFIGSTALQDLGIFAGISVFAASVFTMLVFPHILKGKGDKVEKPKKENVVERFVNAIAAYPYHEKKWSLLLVLGVTVLFSFTWRNYQFENDMLKLNYYPENLEAAEQKILDVSNLDYDDLYLATTANSLNEALGLNQMLTDSLDIWEESGEVEGYLNLNKIVPSPAIQAKRLGEWNAFWQEHSADSVTEQIETEGEKLGFESNAFSTPIDVLLADYQSISKEDIKEISAVFGNDFLVENENGKVTLITLVKAKSEAKDALAQRLESIDGTRLIDRRSIASQLVEILEKDFNKLVLYSLIVVFLILLISYGRIEQALMVYIPILLSWLWVLGIMGLFGLKFNIVNVIVCSFIFGIGVDYSIFVAHGLFQTNGQVKFATSKRAIILSAITTLVGIGALIFAKHPAIKSIALLTIIGISATLIITFTIEPFIYNVFVGRRKEKGLIPYTLYSVCTSVFAFSYFLFGCILLTVLRWIMVLPFAPVHKRKAFFHWTISKFCGSLMYTMANTKKSFVDHEKADFTKPSVIIANHHSFLDILLLLMLHPKLIMVTNSWVYNSPFFGKTVQFADFIHAQEGMENQFETIKAKVDKGFSIIVFPEGSRSASPKLRRFHKGAFFLADQLQIDIQPIVLHGTEFTMPKGDTFYLKNGTMTIQFLDRIAHDDESFGKNYSERTKFISKHFKAEHKKLRLKKETPTYYKELMLKNYLYRGPLLEWYFKVKTKLENNYELFHKIVPLKAKIMDLGCGYGFMSYALALSSEERMITAVDYDDDKIELANDGPINPENIIFKQGDVAAIDLESSDVFILSDVLHYLNPSEQNSLMQNMADNLNVGGKIIVRDSDSSNKNRHQGSKLTEFFSTNFGFNQTRNKLNFVPRTFFEEFATKNKLSLEVIDNTKLTSNLIFVITHQS